jgi:hypothetical protein
MRSRVHLHLSAGGKETIPFQVGALRALRDGGVLQRVTEITASGMGCVTAALLMASSGDTGVRWRALAASDDTLLEDEDGGVGQQARAFACAHQEADAALAWLRSLFSSGKGDASWADGLAREFSRHVPDTSLKRLTHDRAPRIVAVRSPDGSDDEEEGGGGGSGEHKAFVQHMEPLLLLEGANLMPRVKWSVLVNDELACISSCARADHRFEVFDDLAALATAATLGSEFGNVSKGMPGNVVVHSAASADPLALAFGGGGGDDDVVRVLLDAYSHSAMHTTSSDAANLAATRNSSISGHVHVTVVCFSADGAHADAFDGGAQMTSTQEEATRAHGYAQCAAAMNDHK